MEKIIEENVYHRRNRLDRLERLEKERHGRSRRTITLYVIVGILILLSLINMASSNFYIISTKGVKDVAFHAMYLGGGICAFFAGLYINYKRYNKNKLVGLIFLGAIASLYFVVIGAKFFPTLVPTGNGAIGWIRIWKIGVQPSEVMKLAYVIILAHLFEKIEKERYTSGRILATLLPVVIMFIIPIILQKDLGTAIHYMGIFAFMLFMSRFSLKTIFTSIIAGILVSSGVFYYVYTKVDPAGKGYKVQRISSFLNGILNNVYDQSVGYQVGQSLIAFGSGGITGKGYANGVQKYSYLPEIKTDFILACFGEEFGFLGMVGLIIAFLLLFNLIKRVALSTKDYFGKYLAIGIGGYLILQVLINIYVALGMLPVFGIPMPLFSYGGTSIITVMLSLGIVFNINKKGYK